MVIRGMNFCTCTSNAIFDQLRKKQHYQKHRTQFGHEQPEGGGTEEPDELGMDQQHLRKALGQLLEHERLCIEAIFFEELSYKEIMKRHGWSFNQLRGTRERALKKLRDLLSHDFNAYFHSQ